MEKKDYIALLDVDNFYVSCERLFNPRLLNHPVAILSNNDGCVIARCNQCKQANINIGYPAFQREEAKKQWGVEMFSANFPLYEDFSLRMHQIVKSFGHAVEVYSIDEVFIRFEQLSEQQVLEICQAIYSRIQQWIGLPTSIGIGPNKTLAKVAAGQAKQIARKKPLNIANFDRPHDEQFPIVAVLSHSQIEQGLKNFPLEKIWGVGSRLAERLRHYGIADAWSLSQVDARPLYQLLRHDMTSKIHQLQGHYDNGLDQVEAARKSILNSRTFGRHLQHLSHINEAIAVFTARGAIKLRQDQTLAERITVYLQPAKTGDPRSPHLRAHFSIPSTDDTSELITWALKLTKQLWKPNTKYRRAAVVLKATPRKSQLPSLFVDEHRKLRKKLLSTMDHINHKFGRETIFTAAEGGSQHWRAKQRHLSGSFSTSWQELPIANTQQHPQPLKVKKALERRLNFA